ncbi:complexed with cef1p [Linderina macrospora]|uniref:Complexed with cef1p n=1 Tax=Linderina macrospora TaxID=4868 RepID=A0ACC1J225_9FUNG|nr:complexed with cef1p [Linderina macrospora]
MTTAARPTFDPARGKESVVITYQQHKTDLASHTKLKYRQPGQGNEDEYTIEDLKEELREAERKHYETKWVQSGSSALEENPQEKLKFIEMAQRLDAESSEDDDDDDDSAGASSADESDDSDSEDETAMLMRELEKIKRERAEEKAREEQEAMEQELAEAPSVLGENPLLGKSDFAVKRRWDDDVVFRNQARGGDDKPKKRFINDMLRSDFHRKFMKKYVR